MNTTELAKQLTPETLLRVFNTLPSGQRNELAQYGSPEFWSLKIGEVLNRRTGLPENFAAMEFSRQISYAITEITKNDPPKVYPQSPDDFARKATAAVMAEYQAKLSPTSKVRQLIEDGDSSRAASGAGHFLNRQPDVDVRR